ncbi:unnamed protein product [Ectocarpus sp. 8 AP-2014]
MAGRTCVGVADTNNPSALSPNLPLVLASFRSFYTNQQQRSSSGASTANCRRVEAPRKKRHTMATSCQSQHPRPTGSTPQCKSSLLSQSAVSLRQDETTPALRNNHVSVKLRGQDSTIALTPAFAMIVVCGGEQIKLGGEVRA